MVISSSNLPLQRADARHDAVALQPVQGSGVAPRAASRLVSVDAVRGLLMVLMALDHVRHFLGDSLELRPTDLSQTTPALFATRWITHFCAPGFCFLAGCSVFLQARTESSARALSRLLLVRGLWLVLLELTVIRCLGWSFNFDYHYAMAGVIWALGWSMIAMAALVHLPSPAVAGIGIFMIAIHNAFDAVRPKAFGAFGWLWTILHRTGQLEPWSGFRFKIAYPLVPLIGVMAAGYGLGAVLLRNPDDRRRILMRLGLALGVSFVLLRAINVYGDLHPWSAQSTGLLTFLSFINCHKYPPSLLFLLMTLGPLMIALSLFDGSCGRLCRLLATYGRVPLFYYLLHIPLIHLIAVVLSYLRYGEASWLFQNPPARHGASFPFPDGYGYGLPVVYAIWVAVVIALYPACRWFGAKKHSANHAWLRHL